MFQYHCLNPIAQKGLDIFDDNYKKADTLDEIIDETLSAVSSERTSRVIDHEAAGSMERRKREGYF